MLTVCFQNIQLALHGQPWSQDVVTLLRKDEGGGEECLERRGSTPSNSQITFSQIFSTDCARKFLP